MNYDPLVSPAVTPDMPAPHTYWHATTSITSSPTLDKDINTDIAIIGAGYTGLNAAIYLAGQGTQVTLLDANAAGFGCAGRNGGFVLSGTGRLGLPQLQSKFGENTAMGMQSEFDAAVDWITSLIRDHQINCDLTPGPYFKLAYSKKHAEKLQNTTTLLTKTFGNTCEYLSADALKAWLPAHTAKGAARSEGLALHPLKLLGGYLDIARNAGVDIYHNSPVTHIERVSGGFSLTSPTGRINARQLLLTTNAYSPKHFHACIDHRQFPVQSSILVTNPLPDAQAQQSGLTRPMTFMDTRMMKYYYRVLPDGRLLFGGRGEVAGKHHDSFHAKNRLYKAMIKSFPALTGLGINHFWSGWVSVSLDDLPRIRFDKSSGVGYAMGYCGSGVSFAALAGKRLAQQLLGERINSHLPVYHSDLPRFPLPGYRRLALRALYAWATMTKQ